MGARARAALARVPGRWGPVALAAVAALAAYAVSHLVFPYYSTNHDEAVYLQQAELLLEGQLALRPPVETAFRPWFFVETPDGLYPKYAPVPAAVFALGALAGDPRLALAGVAAGVVLLTVAVVGEAFDRRTGLLAGALVLASPLFLVQSALFLPYAPTLLFELAFALAYVRADRSDDRRWAALAGAAAGAAFFARPYTAVLFAAPFVGHALWRLRRGDRLATNATTAAVGLCGVAGALAYNAVVTGSPLVFPYEAFAPRDGIGFGHRALLAHDVHYTPALALRANAEVVARLFGRWVVAGLLGSALAAVGLATLRSRAGDGDVQYRVVLAGLFCSVVAGNVLFWGNLNILGLLELPWDGLVSVLGPYYHFDLVVPTAAFAAHGALTLADRARRELADRLPPARARRVGLAALLVSGAVFAGTAGAALAVPLAENHRTSEQLAVAYEPVEERDLRGALLFLPTPYGDWLNHPFQALRNEPGYDGETVYALRERQLAVVDAFPERRHYRYVYRGEWAPFAGRPVDARVERVRAVRGERVAVDASFGVPRGTDQVSFRLATREGEAYYAARGTPAALNATLVVADGRARLVGEAVVVAGENASVPVASRDEVAVTAFVDSGTGGFDYRIELPVATGNGSVRALTPYRELCYDARRCDGEAAYLPGTGGPDAFVRARFAGGGRA